MYAEKAVRRPPNGASELVHPLRLARLTQGKTLQQVSEPACISISKLSLIERGLQPSPAEILRLSAVLGIPASQLWPREMAEQHV